jgi:hypothetical protein
MTLFELENKIHEIKGYIASDWSSIQQRKELYLELERLEALKKMIEEKG